MSHPCVSAEVAGGGEPAALMFSRSGRIVCCVLILLRLTEGLAADTEIVFVSSRDGKPVPYRIEARPEFGLDASLWLMKGAIGDMPFSFEKKTFAGKEKPAPGEPTEQKSEIEETMFAEKEELEATRPPDTAEGDSLQCYWAPSFKRAFDDGTYVLGPGNHKFQVDGHQVKSDSTFLKGGDDKLEVVCFPVTVRAIDQRSRRRLAFDFRVYYGKDCLFEAGMWAEATFRSPERYRGPWARFFRRLELHLIPADYVVQINAEGRQAGFAMELDGKELKFGPLDASGAESREVPQASARVTGDSKQGWTVEIEMPSPPPAARREPVRWTFLDKNGPAGYIEISVLDDDFDAGGEVRFAFACPENLGKPEAFLAEVGRLNPTWRKLDGEYSAARKAGDNVRFEARYKVPELPSGAFLARLAFTGDIRAEQIVRLNRGEPGSLTVLLDGGRTVFYPNERIEVALILRSAKPLGQVPLAISLDGLGPAHERTLSKPEAGTLTESFDLRFPELAPGSYALTALVKTRPQPIVGQARFEIVSRLKPSHMPYISCFSYKADWVRELHAVDLDIIGVDTMIGNPPYNRLLSFPYLEYDRMIERQREQLSGDPNLPSPEALRPFSELPFAEDLMRAGVGVIPAPIGIGSNWYQNLLHTIPNHESNDVRRMAFSVQYFRHLPNLLGFVHVTADQAMALTTTGTGDDYSRGYRCDLLWQQINRRHGAVKDPVEKAVKSYRDFNDVWSRCLRERIEEMHRIDPQLINMIKFAGSHQFGDQVRDGRYLPQALQPLEVRLAMENTDMGYPALYGPWEADLFRCGPGKDKIVWVTGHYYVRRGRAHIGDTSYPARQLFHILARKADGVGFNVDEQPYHPWEIDAVAKLRQVAARYGDLFLSLDRNDRVALLRGFTEPAAGRGRAYYSRVFEAWTALVRASYPPTILSEEEIAAGALEGFSALFIPGQTVQFLPDVRDALVAFVKNGGRIYTDQPTKIELPGMKKLDVHFDHNWTYQTDGSTEHKQHFTDVAPQVPILRRELGTIFRHSLDSENPSVMVSPLKGGEWEYFVVINDTFPEMSDVCYQRHCLPIEQNLIVNRKPEVIYDLLEQKEVKTFEEGGRTMVAGDFSLLPARIFVFATERVEAIELRAGVVGQGETRHLGCSVRVLGRDGPVRGHVPIELTAVGPDAKKRARLYRCAVRGVYEGSLPVPVNETPGRWQLEVRELLTGLTGVSQFEVAGAAVPPLAIEPRGDVLVFDTHGIGDFFKRAGEKLVLLDVGQSGRRQQAERLVNGLRAKGLDVKLEQFDPDAYVFSYQGWRPTPEDEATWAEIEAGRLIGYRVQDPDRQFFRRGYEFVPYTDWYPPQPEIRRDVILLGWTGESRFIDSALDIRLCRAPSADYPGPGKALIECAWDAFSPRHIALFVLSPDAKGLDKGVGRLLELASGGDLEPDYPDRPLPYPFKDFQSEARGSKLQGRDIQLVPVQSRERRTESFVSENFGHPVSQLIPSQDSSSLLVGLNSYGYNLFLLDGRGATVWKRKVSGFHCDDLALSHDGQRIAVLGGKSYYPNNRAAFSGKASTNYLIADHAGKPLRRLAVEVGGVDLEHGLVFDRVGQVMMAHSLDGKLVWSYDEWLGNERMEDFWHKRVPHYFKLSPDGGLLYVGWWGEYTGPNCAPHFNKPALFVVRPETGEVLTRIENLYPTSITLSHDGKYIAVYDDGRDEAARAAGERWLRIYDSGGKQLASHRVGRPVSHIAVSTKGVAAFSFRSQGTVSRSLWLLSPQRSEPLRLEFPTEPCSLAFSTDGAYLAVGGLDHGLYLLDAEAKVRWTRKVNGIPISTFSPDGAFLFAGTNTGRVYKFGLNSEAGSVLFERNLSGEAFIQDFYGELAALEQVPTLQKEPLAEVQEKPLSQNLPKGVRTSEELFVGGDFEDGIRCELVAKLPPELSEDAYEGKRSLAIRGKCTFPLPARAFEPEGERKTPAPRTYLFEFAQKLKPRATFAVSFSLGTKKIATQTYRGTGRFQSERFAWKVAESRGEPSLTIEAPDGVLLDSLRLREIEFPSKNLAYIPLTPEEAFVAATTEEGGTALGAKKKLPELRLYVFSKTCWEGGGRMSRPEKPELEAIFPPAMLVNGVPYDVRDPVYQGQTWSRKYKWDNARNFAALVIRFPAPKRISTAAIYENNTPGLITQEGLVQGWDEKANDWKLLCAYRDNRHAFHVHGFAPFTTQSVRFVLITAGPEDDLFHTTEFELYSPEEESTDEAPEDGDQ